MIACVIIKNPAAVFVPGGNVTVPILFSSDIISIDSSGSSTIGITSSSGTWSHKLPHNVKGDLVAVGVTVDVVDSIGSGLGDLDGIGGAALGNNVIDGVGDLDTGDWDEVLLAVPVGVKVLVSELEGEFVPVGDGVDVGVDVSVREGVWVLVNVWVVVPVDDRVWVTVPVGDEVLVCVIVTDWVWVLVLVLELVLLADLDNDCVLVVDLDFDSVAVELKDLEEDPVLDGEWVGVLVSEVEGAAVLDSDDELVADEDFEIDGVFDIVGVLDGVSDVFDWVLVDDRVFEEVGELETEKPLVGICEGVPVGVGVIVAVFVGVDVPVAVGDGSHSATESYYLMVY